MPQTGWWGLEPGSDLVGRSGGDTSFLIDEQVRAVGVRCCHLLVSPSHVNVFRMQAHMPSGTLTRWGVGDPANHVVAAISLHDILSSKASR